MANGTTLGERRTSVDEIFDHLYEEISSLRLRPGDRISEAEIAARFNVSRQPVRDAFSRLANLDLLLIRPQRATEVKRFSRREIEKSRFVRASVEKEVLRRAAEHCDASGAAQLRESLERQEKAMQAGELDTFVKLDYTFHQTLCAIAGTEYAFDVILEQKAKVDRLCRLELAKDERMPTLIADHRAITDAVTAHDAEAAVAAGALHLTRLDATIAHITATNASYFEHPEDQTP